MILIRILGIIWFVGRVKYSRLFFQNTAEPKNVYDFFFFSSPNKTKAMGAADKLLFHLFSVAKRMKIFHFGKDSCFDIIIIIRPCYSFQFFLVLFPFFFSALCIEIIIIRLKEITCGTNRTLLHAKCLKHYKRYKTTYSMYSNFNATRPDVLYEILKREIERNVNFS